MKGYANLGLYVTILVMTHSTPARMLSQVCLLSEVSFFCFFSLFFPPIQLLSQWNTNKCIHKVALFGIRIQEGLGYIYSYEINSMD